MRVYMPGRWRTGSSPLRTRIDASPYSAEALRERVALMGSAVPAAKALAPQLAKYRSTLLLPQSRSTGFADHGVVLPKRPLYGLIARGRTGAILSTDIVDKNPVCERKVRTHQPWPGMHVLAARRPGRTRILRALLPVAQWIVHAPPKREIQVRLLAGGPGVRLA